MTRNYFQRKYYNILCLDLAEGVNYGVYQLPILIWIGNYFNRWELGLNHMIIIFVHVKQEGHTMLLLEVRPNSRLDYIFCEV